MLRTLTHSARAYVPEIVSTYGLGNSVRTFARIVGGTEPRDLLRHATSYMRHGADVRLQESTGAWRPTTTAIELTYFCPRRCVDCYIPLPRRREARVMTQTQLDRAIEQCRSVGSNFIGMLGGEPLSEETVPLIDRAAGGNAQATLYVYTNGDHLARQGLGPLAQRHNIAYFVSTDGSTARTHDRLRNAGSFENVCGAFAVLRDAGKFRGAAVTLRGENYNDVTSEHFLEFLVDQGAQVAHIMKAKSLDPRRDMSEANFRNAIGRMKQSLRRVPLFTIFGGQGDGKGSSTDAFSYRELYMMLDGTVRISKAGFNRTYGNWEEEPLADIVGRIAADLLPTM